MNNFTKSILSAIVIGLLSFFVLTKSSFALDVPGVPTAPDKPHPTSPPTAPDKPHPTSPPGVPTVPPVPTLVNGGNGGGTTPAPTTQPNDGNGGGNNPGDGGNGGGGVGGPSNGDGGNGGDSGNNQGQVMGLSKTSSSNIDEIALMIAGLIIATVGFKGVISKKLKI